MLRPLCVFCHDKHAWLAIHELATVEPGTRVESGTTEEPGTTQEKGRRLEEAKAG